MFLMKFPKEFSYDFIDVDIFLCSDHVAGHLKLITSYFFSEKI